MNTSKATIMYEYGGTMYSRINLAKLPILGELYTVHYYRYGSTVHMYRWAVIGYGDVKSA